MPKQGKRPTLKQRKLISFYGKNPAQWLVERDTSKEIVLVHRETGRLITFPKGA